ncbi:hypothetical protein BJV74DRAFT_796208 [Russula compacta]|nr:hypothetical protein BJV74DRAFT_796208 [Russula compacta]
MVCEGIDEILSQVFGAAKIVIDRTRCYPPCSPEVEQFVDAARGGIAEPVMLLVLRDQNAQSLRARKRVVVGNTMAQGKKHTHPSSSASEQTGKVTSRLVIRIPGLRVSGSPVILAPDQMTDDFDEEVDADDELEDDHSIGGNEEGQVGVGGELEIDEEARSEKRQWAAASVDSEIVEDIDSDAPPTYIHSVHDDTIYVKGFDQY